MSDIGQENVEHLSDDVVLIAGGGPIGLLLAAVLSHYGVRSVLLERNETTTKWPKMDLTNGRSMEIFRRLGLSNGLRQQGVAPHISHNVLISTGLAVEKALTMWPLPSVNDFEARIKSNNDGTQPREAWQRISQVYFEAWLKVLCEEDPLIDSRFGWKVERAEEFEDHVRTTATDVKTGVTRSFVSKYLAGCDGASSKVRTSLGLPLDGGPMPICSLLVHFKSKDLTRLHKQGQFWHIFFLLEPGEFGGAIIAQDEIDTWTVHLYLPVGADTSMSSHDAVYTVLGGMNGMYEIKIDEILVRSVWRPSVAVARNWVGPHRRVFLAGDAAHQNIPTGGYGMNMGIGDAYDLGWKLAATINYAGPELLKSYESERRPVALRNVEQSGRHMKVHQSIGRFLDGGDPHRVDFKTKEGDELRRIIHEYYQINNGENQDFGIEMGYIYESNVITAPDSNETKPAFKASEYTPSTWPGARPPHLFLSDGSALFDHFGKDWSIVTFKSEDSNVNLLLDAARTLSVPLKHVDLTGEEHAWKLWEKEMVLIRPDQHVAWRSNSLENIEEAHRILKTVTGMNRIGKSLEATPIVLSKASHAFTSTTGLTTQVSTYELEHMGEFQR